MDRFHYLRRLTRSGAGVGCGGGKEKAAQQAKPKVKAKNPEPPKATPKKFIADPIVEKVIRENINKPTGELTKADLQKVTELALNKKQLTEVPKGLEPESKYARGYGQLFINHVTQAHEGCDFDFLERGPETPEPPIY